MLAGPALIIGNGEDTSLLQLGSHDRTEAIEQQVWIRVGRSRRIRSQLARARRKLPHLVATEAVVLQVARSDPRVSINKVLKILLPLDEVYE